MLVNGHINKKTHGIRTYNFMFYFLNPISKIKALQLVCIQLKGEISFSGIPCI